MTQAFSDVDVAISLMREALSLLDTSEAASAAELLSSAIDAAIKIELDRDSVVVREAGEARQAGE